MSQRYSYKQCQYSDTYMYDKIDIESFACFKYVFFANGDGYKSVRATYHYSVENGNESYDATYYRI